MTWFGRMFVAALFVCFTAGPSSAQEDPARSRIWAAAGLGAAVPTSGGDAITNMAQLVYQKGAHHVAIRGMMLHDLKGESTETSTDAIGELGGIYGRSRTLEWGRVVFASGVSVLAFDACPDDDDSCFTFGLPLVVELSRSGSNIGVGVQTFANINTKASFAGAVLFLQLGRLR